MAGPFRMRDQCVKSDLGCVCPWLNIPRHKYPVRAWMLNFGFVEIYYSSLDGRGSGPVSFSATCSTKLLGNTVMSNGTQD
eukprot:3667122-Pleurochrysis_carterae.AAC.1